MTKEKAGDRVEICGGIASGKTTLASLLTRQGLSCRREDFRANPFWRQFYTEPARFAFETELTFLLQHYHQIKASNAKLIVCDFSLILDRSYVDVTLRGRQRAAFVQLYDHLWDELLPPSLIIHLVCDAAEELRRVRRRARSVEKSIALNYLSSLNLAIERQVRLVARSVRVLRINSGARNFATNKRIREEVAGEVLSALNPGC